MLAAERRQSIKRIVLEKKSASVSALAKRFSVTDETIRRDLKALEKEGVLMRTYGGAFIQSGVENLVEAQLRKTIYIEEKKAIARRCRAIINNGDTIFLDNSTTCYYIAEQIKDMHVTVATNNLMIINLFATNDNIRLVSIGGEFSIDEQAFYGSIAAKILNDYYFDKSFLSCRTLSLENGVTESTDQWALIRRKAIARSNEHYLVADNSKFGHTSFVKISDLDELSAIITCHPLDLAWHQAAEKLGFRIIDGSDAAHQVLASLPADR
ncbi:MAG: DeoR/GlpR family DNA-binding transcription regulator [Collinsella sp.]|nr:DeoR/GlpR family DNA-binding transcription regulator [Collinsella sp.]